MPFMNVGFTSAHDVTAVIEHEAVTVRVPKEIKGCNGFGRLAIDSANHALTGRDPF